MNKEFFKSKYNELDQLFIYFMISADAGVFDNNYTIDSFLQNKLDNKIEAIRYISQVVSEANEVLDISPFPEALICELTYVTSSIQSREEWLRDVVKILFNKKEELEKLIK